MICEGCGFEAPALKTVRWRTGDRRFVLCDPCWLPISEAVWIVPAPFTITSRCEGCGRYVNPSELDPATARPGSHGKRDVVSTGLCWGCAGG